MLRRVLSLIDIAGPDESCLGIIGLEDMLYRLIAVVLAPDSLAPAFAPQGASRSAVAVRRATEHILARLPGAITLSDLERVSGLASRSLQMAFRRVHGTSPRAWIQEQRLLMARERLANASPADSVTGIALACGFTRLGTFVATYAARFGESPSTALARRR